MMRIITGTAKGARLETLEGDATRPTSERVKEAVFSMLQFDIEGRAVLDLFSGSGQLALEALSRGASRAVMLDTSDDALTIMKANAKKTRLFDKCRISKGDAATFLRRTAGREQFYLIFLDPPYALKLIPQMLELIAEGDILASGGFVVCEAGDEGLPHVFTDGSDYFDIFREAKYGRAYVTVLTKRKRTEEASGDANGEA